MNKDSLYSRCVYTHLLRPQSNKVWFKQLYAITVNLVLLNLYKNTFLSLVSECVNIYLFVYLFFGGRGGSGFLYACVIKQLHILSQLQAGRTST